MGRQTTTINTEIKSEFFTLAELTRSETAARHKIDNTPPAAIIKNLQYGVDMVLDPLRRIYGKPIKINSGYRCPQLNKIVGGVANSWHQEGNAADIHIESADEAKILFSNLQKLPSVDTLLFEHSKTAQWLHVQWNMAKNPRHHFNFNYKA